MKKAVLIGPLLFLLSTPAFASMACENVFQKVPKDFINKVTPEARNLADSLKALGESITAAQNPPPAQNSWWGSAVQRSEKVLIWENFEALNQVQKDVEIYSQKLKTMNPALREKERRRALLIFDQHPEIQTVFEYLQQTYPKDYVPTEYDLKRDFLLRVLKIVKTLPPEFRPTISRIPKDVRIAKINAEARELLKRQDAQFRNVFSTTGFKDYATFEKELRSSSNPVVQEAIKLIDSDAIELAIRRPVQARFWVPKVGFQNQFVSGSSNGLLSSDRRNLVEARMTNEKYKTYTEKDNELKPKYGTLDIAPDNGVRSDLQASHPYGGDIYYLKKDIVADRVSFFPGDSLNHFGSLQREGLISRPSWQALLIPWKNRLLMAPFMLSSLSERKFDKPIFDSEIAAKFNLPELKNWLVRRHIYWEFQIFGRVDLSMVRAFKFTDTPPTGEFLETLQKYNIEIIDGREQR